MNSLSPQSLGLVGGQVSLLAEPYVERATATRGGLKRLLRRAWRRRWILLGGPVAGALVGLLVAAVTPRQYAATERLQISRETSQVLTVGAISHDVSIGDQEFYQTQYALLRAQALAERVARDAGVVDDPIFFKLFHRDVDMAGQPGSAAYARRNAIAAQILLDHVEIAPVRGSSLVDVQANTPSRELSRRVAQAWGRGFIASTQERRLDASSNARRFLEARLGQLRERLEQSERLAVEYAARAGIVDLPSPGSADPAGRDAGQVRSLLTDDLVALNTARDVAVTERILAAGRLAASAAQPDASGTALDNRAINLLRRDRATAAADAALLARTAPDDPATNATGAKVDALDAAIAREEGRVRTSMQQTYQAAVSRERALTQRVDTLKRSLTELQRRAIQYNIYKRDADTNRALYDGLLQRYKEISVASAMGVGNVAVVDATRTPNTPASPRPVIDLALFLILGAALGIGGTILVEQLDDTLRDASDLEDALGLPLLGAVPALKTRRPLPALEDPRSDLAEAYLAVLAKLELAPGGGPPGSFTVVSARPREGRSTTAIALARTLARAGREVVLVDADLRAPSLHTAFGLQSGPGLADLLSEGGDPATVVNATDHPRLALVTAGLSPANPADLLLGERWAAAVKRLQDRFDHVIVDAPPVGYLADALLIAAATEGVVWVVRAAATPASDVRAALARLPTQVAGVVLTQAPPGASHGS